MCRLPRTPQPGCRRTFTGRSAPPKEDQAAAGRYNTNYKSQEQVEELYAPTPYRSSDDDPVLVGLTLTS